MANVSGFNIRFIGQVREDKLTEIIERSHLILFPSHMENSSLVPLEAFALGTPVIARDANFNQWIMEVMAESLYRTDEEFLRGVTEWSDHWKNRRRDYDGLCALLKGVPKSPDEYTKSFIEFLRVAK